MIVFMCAAELAERLGDVVVPRTLQRWALDDRIHNAKKLPNGRLVFFAAAIDEISQPVFTDADNSQSSLEFSCSDEL